MLLVQGLFSAILAPGKLIFVVVSHEACMCRTELHFVRCVKPNAAQVAAKYDASLVLHQLRCCGVLEVTRIARAGYPTRYLHQEFADRYGILLTPKSRGQILQNHTQLCYNTTHLSIHPVLECF